jgi:hypothetical protein
MNNYVNALQKGILSKEYFCNSDVTKKFIEWLLPFIEGKRKLSEIGFNYEFNDFDGAIDSYDWKGIDFKKTVNRFKKWRTELQSSDQSELEKTCEMILKWGGGGKLVSRTMEKLRQEDVRNFLDRMNKIFDQDKIKIGELNPYYISSGFTKIYAASNEKFIMYDGRVGAALCYFIRNYLEENKIDSLPDELIFGFGDGMGEQNRNPNKKGVKPNLFKEISSNRTNHFISNIKANWLLETMSFQVTFEEITDDKVFALQIVLFMIGKNLPKS